MCDIAASMDGFFAYINERHRIYLRKQRGDPWPWTTDPILQTYRFTNVYRPLDRVTVDYRRLVAGRYCNSWEKSRAAELLAETVAFRLFNWPATYRRLKPVRGSRWDGDKAKRILRGYQDAGEKIVTGAYIVSNLGSKRPKIELLCEAITAAHEMAPGLIKMIRANRTLQNATAVIAEHVPMCAAFSAYEVVSDLRWTPLLNKAPDIMFWANPGPGAVRGLNRIHGRSLNAGLSDWQANEEMADLLKESQRPGRLGKHMMPLEMRDVEHSLCELDKYLRVKGGEGRLRSKYCRP